MSDAQGSSLDPKKTSLKSFLIRIDGGTKFRGKRPYVVTCVDKQLSSELHRTRAVEGGRKVTWNEAFVIDLSEHYEKCEREGLVEPENLTFVLLDAEDEELCYLGYVAISMYSLRMSQLDHVTEDIRDGKGTLTFSTTPVNEPQSAMRAYAEQVRGYFVRAFEGRKAGKTSGEGDESASDEGRLHKTVDTAKGMAAAAVTSVQSKFSALRIGEHAKDGGEGEKEVKAEDSDKGDGSKQTGEEDEAGHSATGDRVHKTVDAAKGMAAMAVSTMQSKFSALRDGAHHSAKAEGASKETEGTEGSGGSDAGDKVHKTIDAAKDMATKMVAAAQEKLGAKSGGAGAEASAGASASGEGESSGGGMRDEVSKAVKSGKEGLMHSVQQLRKNHGGDSKEDKAGSDRMGGEK